MLFPELYGFQCIYEIICFTIFSWYSTTNNTIDRHDITDFVFDFFCNFHFLDTTDNTEQLHNKTKYIVERGVKHHKPNPY